MAQKEFKKANFAKLFNYNVFFGDYLQYISWSVKNSKTVDTLLQGHPECPWDPGGQRLTPNAFFVTTDKNDDRKGLLLPAIQSKYLYVHST